MKTVNKKWPLTRNRPQNICFLPISYSPPSGTYKKFKWDMCLCILNIILKYFVGTCLWKYWKLTLNTHFLLDFIYFHETIDFSLTNATSSHVQIWKISTKILDGVKVLYNQEFIISLFFRPISVLIMSTHLNNCESVMWGTCCSSFYLFIFLYCPIKAALATILTKKIICFGNW